MPPKTKAATAKSFLGQPSSVLTDEFLQSSQLGDVNEKDILPFSGPVQLPTVVQVVKLYFYLKEQVGLRNSKISQDDIAKQVYTHILKYWKMAGFLTMSETSVRKKILREVENYQSINKNKNRESQTEKSKRDDYLGNVKKLFDVAVPKLEEMLIKDRLLDKDDENPHYRAEGGYTRKTEDVTFLKDQRGERIMVMGGRDITYEMRKDKSNSKKVGIVDRSNSKIDDISNAEGVESAEDSSDDNHDDDDERDSEFENKIRSVKNKNTILVELPRDIMNNNEVCTMLDRTATTTRNAVGIVSSILKSGKVDGQALDLNEFTLSRTSLDRKRVSIRSVLMEKSMQEFQDNKPKYPALHWDGAMIKDVTGSLQENEASLVSGAPNYIEGKLLSVIKLVTDEGKPTTVVQGRLKLQQFWSKYRLGVLQMT